MPSGNGVGNENRSAGLLQRLPMLASSNLRLHPLEFVLHVVQAPAPPPLASPAKASPDPLEGLLGPVDICPLFLGPLHGRNDAKTQ